MINKKKKKRKNTKKININQILLKKRQLTIFESIDENTSNYIIEHLLALDSLNHKPITIRINSGGGNVSAGLSIIDTIKEIKSPIHTIIVGEACSMAGIISIVGNKRFMTKNSIWMGHDMSGGVFGDYTSKVVSRVDFLQKLRTLLDNIIKENTKLNDKDIEKATNQELWLFAPECLKKGIVDKII